MSQFLRRMPTVLYDGVNNMHVVGSPIMEQSYYFLCPGTSNMVGYILRKKENYNDFVLLRLYIPTVSGQLDRRNPYDVYRFKYEGYNHEDFMCSVAAAPFEVVGSCLEVELVDIFPEGCWNIPTGDVESFTYKRIAQTYLQEVLTKLEKERLKQVQT